MFSVICEGRDESVNLLRAVCSSCTSLHYFPACSAVTLLCSKCCCCVVFFFLFLLFGCIAVWIQTTCFEFSNLWFSLCGVDSNCVSWKPVSPNLKLLRLVPWNFWCYIWWKFIIQRSSAQTETYRFNYGGWPFMFVATLDEAGYSRSHYVWNHLYYLSVWYYRFY